MFPLSVGSFRFRQTSTSVDSLLCSGLRLSDLCQVAPKETKGEEFWGENENETNGGKSYVWRPVNCASSDFCGQKLPFHFCLIRQLANSGV